MLAAAAAALTQRRERVVLAAAALELQETIMELPERPTRAEELAARVIQPVLAEMAAQAAQA